MSYGGAAPTDFTTARGRDWPSVRQFSIFVENRVGVLLDLMRKIEMSSNRIVALSVVDSADCAVVRLVLSDPERAVETLAQAKYPFMESDLVVVQLPDMPQPIARICKALLSAEINIHYAYPIMGLTQQHACVAIHVEDHETACQTLQSQGFRLLTEKDFQE
jgi:hypothetical protein